MTELTLFLGQDKGLKILEYLLSRQDIRVARVFVSQDSNVNEDHSDHLIQLAGEKYCSEEDFDFSRADGFALAIGYRKMIRWADRKLIVLHDSVLPRYRGFSPLPSMLINGEERIGVTAFLANDHFDSGDIVSISRTKISYPITLRLAMDLNIENYLRCTSEVITKIQRNKAYLHGSKQNDRRATYSLWRDQNDYHIDWGSEASRIMRFIDSVGEPYEGAKTRLYSRTIRIIRAAYAGKIRIENLTVGKVMWWSDAILKEDRRPTVACGTGLIEILEAYYEDNGESIFPTPSYRIRFG